MTLLETIGSQLIDVHTEPALSVLKPSAQPGGLSPTACNQHRQAESSHSSSEGTDEVRMRPQQSKRTGQGPQGRGTLPHCSTFL